MQNISDKIDNDPGPNGNLPASQYNSHKNELQNTITKSGQSLTVSDPDQLSKALGNYAAGGMAYVDNGSPGVYVLATIGTKEGITLNEDGQEFLVKAANANPGAATANVNAQGVFPIVDDNDGALGGGEIVAGRFIHLIFDSTKGGGSGGYILQGIAALQLPPTHLNGMVLSNYTLTTIDVSAGKARNDPDTQDQIASSGQTLDITAAWVEGGPGAFAASGALASNTDYWIHSIAKVDGTTSWGYDDSLTAANLLAAAASDGYVTFRRIGFAFTDGSSDIIPMFWLGNRAWFDTPVNEFSTASEGTSPTIRTFGRVPKDLKFNIGMHTSAADDQIAGRRIYVSDPDQPANTPSDINNQNIGESSVAGVIKNNPSNFDVTTNTLGQIRTEADQTGASHSGSVIYIDDFRGKN